MRSDNGRNDWWWQRYRTWKLVAAILGVVSTLLVIVYHLARLWWLVTHWA